MQGAAKMFQSVDLQSRRRQDALLWHALCVIVGDLPNTEDPDLSIFAFFDTNQ